MNAKIESNKKIAVLIENTRLDETLEKQNLFEYAKQKGFDIQKIWTDKLIYEPGNPQIFDGVCLIVNRQSPSASTRKHTNSIFATRDILSAATRAGISIINPLANYEIEISKSQQIQLLSDLKLPFPRSIVVNRPKDLLKAAREIGFPVLIKSGISALGRMTSIFYDEESLNAAFSQYDETNTIQPEDCGEVNSQQIPYSLDLQWLVQEKKKPRNGKVYRAEILGNSVLYVVEVEPKNFGACVGTASTDGRAFAIDPNPEVVEEVRQIARGFHLDVGGVEYLIDEADGQRYYFDLNALSNYADPKKLREKFKNEPQKYNLRGVNENNELVENINPFHEFGKYIALRAEQAQRTI